MVKVIYKKKESNIDIIGNGASFYVRIELLEKLSSTAAPNLSKLLKIILRASKVQKLTFFDCF